MKFLLELVVPCFGSQQQFHHQTAATADDSISNETQSLLKQRRRRKRLRVSGPGHVAEWRPSLSVILENKPAITEKSKKGEEEERKVRRKSEAGGGEASSRSGGDHVRFRSDDFGRHAFGPVIPAFSPTPFMF